MERIQGEGGKGFREKVGKDTERRLERTQGEGWIRYGEKVEKDKGRRNGRLERIKGEDQEA